MKRLKQLIQYSLVAVGTVMLTTGFNAGSVTGQVSNGSIFDSKTTNVESVDNNKKTVGQPTHVISVTLTNPEDLKVKEGSRVEKGDIVSDRTLERQRLEVKKQQLEAAFAEGARFARPHK